MKKTIVLLISVFVYFILHADAVLSAQENAEKSVNPKDDGKSDGCEMLIITHPDFEDAANTLASWKIRRGIYTQVVTTDDTGPDGDREDIEAYIDNAYDTWSPAPEYLLFIGDAEFVPPCYDSLHPSGGNQGVIGTDFFYADRNNPTDFEADFGYGRLSVDSAAQANSLVEHIISYERTPPTDPDYYTNILNVAMFQDGEGNSGIDSVADRRFCKTSEDIRNYLLTQGYASQREYVAHNELDTSQIFPMWWSDTSRYIFENDGEGGIEIPWSLQKPTFHWDGHKDSIADAFNTGVFFAVYNGHGSRPGWNGVEFKRNDVGVLINGENRPLIWSIACNTGWFDNESDAAICSTNYHHNECFAEHWLRHPTGGSCGIVASTRRSSSGYNDRLAWGMMDAIWPFFLSYCNDPYGGPDPIYRMGDVLNYGKKYMFDRCETLGTWEDETVQMYHWFGDPTTEMWTSVPIELTSAEVTSSIEIGTASIDVQVYPATENMLVAICTENEDGIFGTAFTDISGVATVPLNHAITMEDAVFVTITKHNYIPFEFAVGWATATWEGDVSNFWHDQNNWDINVVPDYQMDVIIPDGTPNDLWIIIFDAECQNITVESGALLKIYDEDLTVIEDMTIHGEMEMTQNTAKLYVNNDIIWESGSTASILDHSAEIWVKGIWSFNPGSNVQLDMGYVEFDGSTDGFITCKSSDSYFNNLRSDKDAGASLYYSVQSTEDLIINGNLYNYEDSKIQSLANQNIILRGSFNNFSGASIELDYGTFVFEGVSQNISMNSSDHFNNLTISSSGITSLSTDIISNGDILIESGTLVTNSHIIRLGGNWTNTVGEAAFDEGLGRVIIWGADYPQYCNSNETFYELELNKIFGGAFCIDGYDVTCAAYDWTIGGLNILSGSFTVNDLIDDGLYGDIQVAGGSLTIYQGSDAGDYVDFNGALTITGGVVEIYGGADNSWWSFGGDASFTMSNGSLEFKNVGIRIYNSSIYSFNEDITGGTIINSFDFDVLRDNFTPEGGVVKMTSTQDATISMTPGSGLFHLVIDKSAKSGSGVQNLRHPRIKSSGSSSKSNSVSATTNLDINGDFAILTGSFIAPPVMNIAGSWYNFVGESAFDEGTGWVYFDGSEPSVVIYNSETFYNLIEIKTSDEDDALTIEADQTLTVLNDLQILDGALYMPANNELDIENQLLFEAEAGFFSNNGTINIGGDWINYNTTLDSNSGFHCGNSTVTFDGPVHQYLISNMTSEEFYNLIIEKTKSAGDDLFEPQGNIRVLNNLNVIDGHWFDTPAGNVHEFYGDINIGINGSWTDAVGVVNLLGSSGKSFYNNGTGYFDNILCNMDNPSYQVFAGGDLEFNIFNINTGNVYLAKNNYQNHSGIFVDGNGTLSLEAGAKLATDPGSGITVYFGGKIAFNGTPIDNCVVTINGGSGYYAFNIEGEIAAAYTEFSFMLADGISVLSDGYVDPNNAFSYCIFSNGETEGTYLSINSDQNLTCDGAFFHTNTWGGNSNVRKTVDQGGITFTNFSGDFSGEDHDDDVYNRIHWDDGTREIDLTVFLEGPFNGGVMKTSLYDKSLIPLVQPYNFSPWNYTGTESVPNIPNPDITDWILIEYRDAVDAVSAIPATAIGQQAAFLLNDGSVVDLDGSSILPFNYTINQSLFVIIYHRNHLGIMSAIPLTEAGGVLSYDFTIGASQAYGTDAQKNIGGGFYAMYAGDGDANGTIETADKSTVWGSQAGLNGYYSGDFNMNGQVMNQDKNDNWYLNLNKQSQVP